MEFYRLNDRFALHSHFRVIQRVLLFRLEILMATIAVKSKAVKRRLAIFFMVFDLYIYPIRGINIKFVTKKIPQLN